MDVCGGRGGLGGDDGAALQRPVRIVPGIPYPGKGKQFLVLQPDEVRLLMVVLFLPFIVTVYRDQAAAFLN